MIPPVKISLDRSNSGDADIFSINGIEMLMEGQLNNITVSVQFPGSRDAVHDHKDGVNSENLSCAIIANFEKFAMVRC